ncbi:hypothetical protein TGAM01_v200882 [Trichoderma gamsii]|uniref:Uncharacterized protein n=1 Tax=Trichoderma gamsii TaxID=398673 RepID=A0A2P5A1P6_9HYPO|nr:hypothetical protein TGAM01_v200882 [Trichoderma gamsii]PON30442.1 hypothetical protein TGAM01_v200882 [Trichoderma gamsii]
MPNASNRSHREYCAMLQRMDLFFWLIFWLIFWSYLEFRTIFASQIDQGDTQYDQGRGEDRDERDKGDQDDHDDTYMEDVVMGGTSPD